MRGLVVIVGALVLAVPGSAGASTINFDGTFARGFPDSAVHFQLTNGGTEVHGWTWRHLPIQCREGSDANSGTYSFHVNVHNHHFQISDVVDPQEGFTTKLTGTLTSHDRKASGSFSMKGPEDGPPRHTHCHGTRTWSATGVKLGDLVYPAQSFQAPGNQATLDSQDCPQDHQNVAGGGIDIVSSAGSLLDLHVGQTSPTFSPLDPDSWLARANNTGTAPATMLITAICSNAPLKHESANHTFAPGARSTVGVSCPPGTHVAGGGVADTTTTGVDNLIRVQSSRPTDSHDPGPTPDDGWEATLTNEAASASAAVKVTAICSEANSFEYVHTAPQVVDPRGTATATARCPNDTRVSGGGVDMQGPDASLSATRPFDGGDPNAATDDGWFARAANGSSSGSHTMQAFAICEK